MKRFGGIVTRDGSRVGDARERSLVEGLRVERDRVSTFREEGVLLVQFDESAERRTRPASSVPAVGDVRVDNRAEVARGLGVPEDTAETDLLLRAARQDGDRGLASVIGAYSFAAWDPASRTLTCARDHFGVRPFYYVDDPAFFAFASSLPALAGLVESGDLDQVRIAQYLEQRPADEDRTFYRAIKRLRRAHRLMVSAGNTSLKPYWSPQELGGGYDEGTDEDLVEEFRDAFKEAVRCRVEADLPVGSFLSGGLDSSSVACTARRILAGDRPLYTFSAVFPELEQPYRDIVDESRFIEEIVTQPGYESSLIRGDRLSPLYGLDRILEIHGQPVDPPNAYLDFAMYELAASSPARVIVDGLEGDVTISHGVHYLDELAALRDWRGFFREARGIERRLSGDARRIFGKYGWPHLAGVPLASLAYQAPALLASGGPGILARALLRRLRNRRGRPAVGSSRRLISSRLAEAVGWQERIQDAPPISEQEAHIRYLGGAYVPSLLEFTHANANHFGLEARHPMFDLRLVRRAVRLRPGLKLHDGWNRYVLRLAMQDVVPDNVLWRPAKASLAPNFDLKMTNQDKPLVDSIMEADMTLLGEFVEIGALRAMASGNAYRRIWPAIVLALYLK